MTEEIQVRHQTVLDDTARQVAQVYADALYDAAEKQDDPDAVLADLRGLVDQVFAKDPALEVFLASGVVSRERKEAALRKAFEGKASDTFIGFLLTLNSHDRLGLLRQIAETFGKLHDERSGRMPVVVRSAVALDDDQIEQLREQLRSKYNKEPVLETHVDPDLLGGLVLRVGDWVFDGSVRSRLEAIRDQLMQRSGYEIQSRRDRFRSD